jgi:hypothetical protein
LIGGDLDVGEEGSEQMIVTLQSLHHGSLGHQEGLSLQVQLRTQARIGKNATKLADECVSSRMWGFTNRRVVKLFLTD